jgi:hypothetical protein
MIVRLFGAVVAASGLALAPLATDAHLLVVLGCGTAAHLLMVPGDPAAPKDAGGCVKACHAITERRGKSPGMRTCCD